MPFLLFLLYVSHMHTTKDIVIFPLNSTTFYFPIDNLALSISLPSYCFYYKKTSITLDCSTARTNVIRLNTSVESIDLPSDSHDSHRNE